MASNEQKKKLAFLHFYEYIFFFLCLFFFVHFEKWPEKNAQKWNRKDEKKNQP